jgi:hypothetical protein
MVRLFAANVVIDYVLYIQYIPCMRYVMIDGCRSQAGGRRSRE